MIKIYSAGDILEAHIVRGLLEAEGIEAHVRGHYLQGGVGELATQDFATIHVNDEQADQAGRVIREYESNQATPGPRSQSNSWLKALLLVITGLVLLIIFSR